MKDNKLKKTKPIPIRMDKDMRSGIELAKEITGDPGSVIIRRAIKKELAIIMKEIETAE